MGSNVRLSGLPMPQRPRHSGRSGRVSLPGMRHSVSSTVSMTDSKSEGTKMKRDALKGQDLTGSNGGCSALQKVSALTKYTRISSLLHVDDSDVLFSENADSKMVGNNNGRYKMQFVVENQQVVVHQNPRIKYCGILETVEMEDAISTPYDSEEDEISAIGHDAIDRDIKDQLVMWNYTEDEIVEAQQEVVDKSDIMAITMAIEDKRASLSSSHSNSM